LSSPTPSFEQNPRLFRSHQTEENVGQTRIVNGISVMNIRGTFRVDHNASSIQTQSLFSKKHQHKNVSKLIRRISKREVGAVQSGPEFKD